MTNMQLVKNIMTYFIYSKQKASNIDLEVKKKVDSLTEKDFTRLPEFNERVEVQKEFLKLPILPTTTIGSFHKQLM
jgi:5-methyltetrahydropteroyltriglutamate--homocysteine methyltransferase